MIIKVSHTTRYTYNKPIFLEPHTIRLRPREDVTQRILHYQIDISPRPAGITEGTGADGEPFTHAWFDKETKVLQISSEFEAETFRTNPFDFIIMEPWALEVPINDQDEFGPVLAPYQEQAEAKPVLVHFVKSVLEETGSGTMAFLTGLNHRIHEQIGYQFRKKGDAHPPHVTLERGEGACRDLAVLFLAACRIVGLPARFVSGYHAGNPERDGHHLHAWAEVFLPGGGWRGFDPTEGISVGDLHIAVASGFCSVAASPVSGSYRSDEAHADMLAEIQIQTFEDEA